MVNYEEVRDDISKLPVYGYMHKVFTDKFVHISDDNYFLKMCEYYKILPSIDLVSILNKHIGNKEDFKFVIQDSLRDIPEFESIKYNLKNRGHFIYRVDYDNKVVTLSTSTEFYYDNTISLMFPEYSIEKVLLTPLNFETLLGLVDPELYNPIVKFLRICAEGILMKATDIRFSAYTNDGNKEFPIKLRMGNDLVPNTLFKLDKNDNALMISTAVELYSHAKDSSINSPNGLTIKVENPFNQNSINLRVSVLKTLEGYLYSVRPIGDTTIISEVEYLGFNERVNSVIKRMTRMTSGLSLVTGPIRSGKSTTLLAVFNQLQKRPISILELSSPVESPMAIDSFEYSSEESLMGATSIAKKLDLNVVLLNELPDERVAKRAYDLLNSSVAVYSTFHIDRVWHLFYKISEYFGSNINHVVPYINYIVNQKAYVHQCQSCKQTKVLDENVDDDEVYPEVVEYLMEKGFTTYTASEGCEDCNYTKVVPGIKPYAEYLVFTDELRKEIVRCKEIYEIEELIRETVEKEKCSLEYFVLDDVRNGLLHPNQVLNLI